MKPIRTYHELAGPDQSGLAGQIVAQRDRVAARLASVQHVVAVASGKGGVGKSFVTASLAAAMARAGRRVGVLDADLHGPTTARMLGAAEGHLQVTPDGVVPPETDDGIAIVSTELLLEEGAPLRWKEPDQERFVWRGTLEAGMLREFLGDVVWGERDLLLVDLPPGTDRLDALAQLVPGLAGVLLVTIPSDASLHAVRRAAEAAQGAHIALLGIVENMAGYACPSCGVIAPLFQGDAGITLANATGAPLLASIPFDSDAQTAADSGRFRPTGKVAAAFRELADGLLDRIGAA